MAQLIQKQGGYAEKKPETKITNYTQIDIMISVVEWGVQRKNGVSRFSKKN